MTYSSTEDSGWCVIAEKFYHMPLSRKAPEWLRVFPHRPWPCGLMFKTLCFVKGLFI